MRPSRLALLSLVAAALLPLAGSGCSSSSEPARVAATITVTPSSVSFTAVGQTQQLAALVKDQFGDTLPGAVVAWSTGNAAAVTVSASGLATAVANGTAQVTVTSGSASHAVTVTVAQAPAALVRVSGDGQTGLVGQALAQPLVVRVDDANAHPIQGVTVTFTATTGSGSFGTATTTTGSNGQAQTAWTLGTAAVGAQSAAAVATGLAGSPVSFGATGTGTAILSVYAGANQTGLVGYALNVRPAVRLTDMGGTPQAGVSVTFAVASGGGSATGTTVTTNGDGVAQVASWSVGSSAGTNRMTASVSGTGVVGNPTSFAATAAEAAFNITITNAGPAFSTDVQNAFTAAIAKWQRVIFGDVPDVAIPALDAGWCGLAWTPAIPAQNLDDVIIAVKVDSMDGPGNVLGSAGFCAVRTDSRLPALGIMRLDTADLAVLIAAGRLAETITHEMGHILGFGTLWSDAAINCVQDLSSSGTVLDTYFSCPRAVAMFDSIGGTSYTGGHKVPVENCGPASPAGCGEGTVNGHWREPVLEEELMTGYISVGEANPLSRLSAAGMEDIGYRVNYAGADSYSNTFSLRAGGAAGLRLFLGGDIYDGPLFTFDRAGRLVPVVRRGTRR